LVDYYRVISILDSRTSEICRTRAGVVVPKDELWRIGGLPPWHGRCRTTIGAVMSQLSRFQEMVNDPANDPANRELEPLPKGWRTTGGAPSTSGQGATAASKPVTYQDFIIRGKANFANEVKAIENAYKLQSQDEVNRLLTIFDSLESDFLRASDSGDFALLQQLGDQLITVGEQIARARESQFNLTRDAFTSLRESVVASGDAEAAKANASKVKMPRRSKNQPHEGSMYRSELATLYQLTDNQVGTLEKLYYKEPRAFAAKPGIRYRGEPNDTTGRINVGRKPSWQAQVQTLYHEYGHHLEFSREDYAEAARQWVQSRATSTTPVRLKTLVPGSGYGPDEKAFPDKFINPYVGKWYGDGSTEVISMGLEQFATPELMQRFYENDPDHFFLILGMLR
jgi:hypothetical protein